MRVRHALLAGATSVLATVGMASSAATHTAAENGSALLQALRDADDPRAASLLENKKTDVNARDETGASALAWAAQRRNKDMVARLLAAGANPNLVSENGVGPLQVAITNHRQDIVRLLLEKGAKPNVARDTGETPLMTAARTGQLEIMRDLIAHGAKVNARESMFGQTALMWSAGYPEQVKLLIANRADIKARTKVWKVTNTIYTPPITTIGVTGIPWNNDGEYVSRKGGQSALFFATQKNDHESVKALLDAGADVNAHAADGSTALLLALYKWDQREMDDDARKAGRQFRRLNFAPNLETARLLLDRGAKVNVADTAGYTPLHGAVLSLVTNAQLAPPQIFINEVPEEDTKLPIDAREGVGSPGTELEFAL